MNQEQLNVLWDAGTHQEIEALRVVPYVHPTGLIITVVHRDRLLQTMLVSSTANQNYFAETYIRRREDGRANWSTWLSCSGDGMD